MKHVAIMKKPKKGWALLKDNATGHFLVGYTGDHPINGTYDTLRQKIAEAQDYIDVTPAEDSRHYKWMKQLSQLEAFAFTPIFEEDLIFTGHSKGQSSFTLDFVTACGQKVQFGPQASEALFYSLLEKVSPIIDMTGKLGPSVIDDFNERDSEGKCIQRRHPYVGNGVRVRFFFQKQGQNIYAQVTEE